eukprot:442064_1
MMSKIFYIRYSQFTVEFGRRFFQIYFGDYIQLHGEFDADVLIYNVVWKIVDGYAHHHDAAFKRWLTDENKEVLQSILPAWCLSWFTQHVKEEQKKDSDF